MEYFFVMLHGQSVFNEENFFLCRRFELATEDFLLLGGDILDSDSSCRFCSNDGLKMVVPARKGAWLSCVRISRMKIPTF